MSVAYDGDQDGKSFLRTSVSVRSLKVNDPIVVSPCEGSELSLPPSIYIVTKVDSGAVRISPACGGGAVRISPACGGGALSSLDNQNFITLKEYEEAFDSLRSEYKSLMNKVVNTMAAKKVGPVFEPEPIVIGDVDSIKKGALLRDIIFRSGVISITADTQIDAVDTSSSTTPFSTYRKICNRRLSEARRVINLSKTEINKKLSGAQLNFLK